MKKNDNGFLNLIINVVIPSVILTKFSAPEKLGQVNALILALSFPILYGAWDFFTKKKFNFISALGLLSVILTGGIGLLKLDKTWMIVKETSIPLIIGLAVLYSQRTSKPLAKVIFEQIFNLEKIKEEFSKTENPGLIEELLKKFGYYLSYTFFLSAFLNFVLAKVILIGEPGSVEFNESLGKMTALSFPVISVPTLIVLGFIIFKLINTIKHSTNKDIEEFLNT